LFVSNEDAAELSIVDMATGTVQSRVKSAKSPRA
jgi:hypothetical protein